ncbi:acyl-CoA dehydrogenase [Streptomyces apocyni]|uniref:acyl-CoA dehydrogenase n=1 Tax=Streptomyces apocyni TaxID=2654677 RepID=UPI001E648353|nr:acyl-CoA dehydrogenase [Streptomyces apocyni]
MSEQAVLRFPTRPGQPPGAAPPAQPSTEPPAEPSVESSAEPPPDALDRLGRDADGRQVWAALGATGRIAEVYRDGDPAAGVDQARLAALLADVDARVGIPALLPVVIQLATSVPLLTLDPVGGPAARALADALTGTSVTALAATDEAAGSDLTALGTELRISPQGLELNGGKRWIAAATHAGQFLVLARHRPGRHFTSFTWVLVPATAPGVQVEAADTELFAGSGTGHIRFDGVRLPREHLVGRPGRGLVAFAAHISVERLAGALWGVALCRRVLTDTKRWLERRQVGDGPLWQLESVRQRYATCLLLVRQLHAMTRDLGPRVVDAHDATAAALLKSSAALTLERVLAECAQFRGAEGFTASGMQQTRAQAALWSIGGGTTEVVLSTVAGSADTVLAELAP